MDLENIQIAGEPLPEAIIKENADQTLKDFLKDPNFKRTVMKEVVARAYLSHFVFSLEREKTVYVEELPEDYLPSNEIIDLLATWTIKKIAYSPTEGGPNVIQGNIILATRHSIFDTDHFQRLLYDDTSTESEDTEDPIDDDFPEDIGALHDALCTYFKENITVDLMQLCEEYLQTEKPGGG